MTSATINVTLVGPHQRGRHRVIVSISLYLQNFKIKDTENTPSPELTIFWCRGSCHHPHFPRGSKYKRFLPQNDETLTEAGIPIKYMRHEIENNWGGWACLQREL